MFLHVVDYVTKEEVLVNLDHVITVRKKMLEGAEVGSVLVLAGPPPGMLEIEELEGGVMSHVASSWVEHSHGPDA